MKYLVVSTCNAEQWTQYGRAMVRTYRRYWPEEVPLWMYVEGFCPDELAGDPVPFQTINLDVAAPWLVEFKLKYKDDPRYRGGVDRRDYRRDALRFCHKVAAIGAAAENIDYDVLLWIDADVVTHSRVTIEWLDSLFPPPATIAWLDRVGSHPECGFMMFRMPDAQGVITKTVKMYRSGSVFQLLEHHDSYVFQHVANAAVSSGKAKFLSLSGNAGRAHVRHPWVASRLAECMDHLKGEIRKAHGSSLDTDLPKSRSEPYWLKVKGK